MREETVQTVRRALPDGDLAIFMQRLIAALEIIPNAGMPPEQCPQPGISERGNDHPL
jgi:hypothetical protein